MYKNRLEIINKLNSLADLYTEKVQDAFSLWDYKFDFNLTVHFKDRLMQRYPTYEVAENLVTRILDSFIEKYSHYICKGISEEVKLKLVNIKHENIDKQNVIVLKVLNENGIITISCITMFQVRTSSIKLNESEYVLLNKKRKPFIIGDVGKKLIKFSKSNNIPDELKCLTKLWS